MKLGAMVAPVTKAFKSVKILAPATTISFGSLGAECGLSDMYEGFQDIYKGVTGEGLDKPSRNFAREAIGEKAYPWVEGISMFVTSIVGSKLCLQEGSAAGTTKAGFKSAKLGDKLDYIFGKATGRQHNIERSQSMQAELTKIGIYDNSSGREYLTQHLNDVLNNKNNISSIDLRSYVAKELPGQPTIEYIDTTRESLLKGPGGFVKLETHWNEDRLLTIIIKAGE